MGSGIAAIIRRRYPKVFDDYIGHAETHGLKLGDLIWSVNEPHVVINLVSQENYGADDTRYASYDALATGFTRLNQIAAGARNDPQITEWCGGPIDAIAMPLIGAGLANGRWPIISSIIETHATDFQPVVYLIDGVIPK